MSRPPLATLRAALAVVLVVSGSLLPVGCGSSGTAANGIGSKTPEQIVAAAKNAAAGAATVHVTGSIISEHKPISLDMELVAGKGAKGRITLEGLAIDLVDYEHAFYLSGSAAFYEHIAGSAAAALLKGKWLKAPANSGNFSSLAQLTKLDQLVGTTIAGHGRLARGADATVEGEKAVALEDTTNGGTLYIAATGTPYPLEITRSGSESGRIRFNRWNKPVTLSAPAGAINIDQLQNGR